MKFYIYDVHHQLWEVHWSHPDPICCWTEKTNLVQLASTKQSKWFLYWPAQFFVIFETDFSLLVIGYKGWGVVLVYYGVTGLKFDIVSRFDIYYIYLLIRCLRRYIDFQYKLSRY